MYRCEARSVSEFIRQLAVNYVSRGYFFYVRGKIPAHKDPAKVDEKMVVRYGIVMSKWTRARRKRMGVASVQYLRLRHLFVLLATHGEHPIFQHEASVIADLRRIPLKVAGYSISVRRFQDRDRVSVRIAPEVFKRLRNHFAERALQPEGEKLVAEMRGLRLEPFGPVCRQVSILVRLINRRRRAAGLEPLFPVRLRPLTRGMRRGLANPLLS